MSWFCTDNVLVVVVRPDVRLVVVPPYIDIPLFFPRKPIPDPCAIGPTWNAGVVPASILTDTDDP